MLNYFLGFPFVGYAKIVIAVFFIATGLIEKQTHVTIVGCSLFIMTLPNKGICSNGMCKTPQRKHIR